MLLHKLNLAWLHIVVHYLSAEISIEFTCSAAQEIWFCLKIVCLQMLYQTGSHMLMIWSWSNYWVKLRASLFLEEHDE